MSTSPGSPHRPAGGLPQGDQNERDDALLARLAAAARSQTPPPEVVAAAKATFTWRTVDAELAELSYDSLLEAAATGVRGGPGAGAPRALSFSVGDAAIELEVEAAGATRRLEGQVVPAEVARLELHRLDGPAPIELATDHVGRFRAEGVRPGRLRLLCRFVEEAGGGTFMTEWVTV
jgi:hypothetical protein